MTGVYDYQYLKQSKTKQHNVLLSADICGPKTCHFNVFNNRKDSNTPVCTHGYASVIEHIYIDPCALSVGCRETRTLSLYSTVHHVLSSQIRKLGNDDVFVFFRVCTFPSPVTPTLRNTNTLPSNATVHRSDPSMLKETLWQYYHVNEVRAFGRSLLYQKHACQSSSVLSVYTSAQRACGSRIHSPKVNINTHANRKKASQAVATYCCHA